MIKATRYVTICVIGMAVLATIMHALLLNVNAAIWSAIAAVGWFTVLRLEADHPQDKA